MTVLLDKVMNISGCGLWLTWSGFTVTGEENQCRNNTTGITTRRETKMAQLS